MILIASWEAVLAWVLPDFPILTTLTEDITVALSWGSSMVGLLASFGCI